MELDKITWKLSHHAQWTVLYDGTPVINTFTTDEHNWRVMDIHNQELANDLIPFMEEHREALLIGKRVE